MRPDERLLIIGDSIALGITELRGRDIVSTTHPTCVDYLRDFFRESEIIVNAEVHRKTGDVLATLPLLFEINKPHRVLLELGGNDADIDWKRFIASRGRVVRTQVSVDKMRGNLLKVVEIARQYGVEPLLTLFSSHCLAIRGEYLSRFTGLPISDWLSQNGGELTSDRMTQQYWHMIQDVASCQNVRLVPYGQALKSENPSQVLAVDGTHPSAAGHRIIARCMIATLTNSSESVDVLEVG